MDKQTLRRWNRNLHRDIGYLCVGLTIIYAVSGIAVNHINDWNPNYSIERSTRQILPLDSAGKLSAEQVNLLLKQLDYPGSFDNFFQSGPRQVRIFAGGSVFDVNLGTGKVHIESVKTRPILYAFNFLHLNHPKRLWTFVADLYAVALVLLAITGMFVLRGKKGITGRGAWLTMAGVLIPIIFLFLYQN